MSGVSFYERRLRSSHTECKMLTFLWPEESGTAAWHRRGSGRPRAGRQPCPQCLQSRSGPGGTPGRPLCPGTCGVRVPWVSQKVSLVLFAKSGSASPPAPGRPCLRATAYTPAARPASPATSAAAGWSRRALLSSCPDTRWSLSEPLSEACGTTRNPRWRR